MKNEQFWENTLFPFYTNKVTLQADEEVGEHSHEFFELAYVAEGSGEHQYNNGNFHSIKPGDVFIIEPDIVHDYRVNKHESAVIYNVLFNPSLLQAELDTMSAITSFVDFFYVEPLMRNDLRFNTRLTLQAKQQVRMRALLDGLILEQQNKNLGYQIMVKTEMIQLFVFLSRCYQQMDLPVKVQGSDEQTIHHIHEFIHRHYKQPLTLDQISHISGMSPSVFSVKFKQHTGQTLIEYRNEIRLNVAKEALLNTDSKILNIAQEVGFDDLSFFNKQFKKKLGLSPGKFRKLDPNQHLKK
jgi:AraC-like DNA-binding protein/mannose-6-phosphate isomerase-like protein (cupin superfamily)